MGVKEALKEAHSVITALLTAEPGDGIDIVRVDSLYRDSENERIPYRRLGYSSLTEFLKDIPGIEIQSRYGADKVYFAGKQSTDHVKQLVAQQRSQTRRHSRSRSCFKRPSAQYYTQPRIPPPPRRYDGISDKILDIIQQNPRGLSRFMLLQTFCSRYPDSNLDNNSLGRHLNILQNEIKVRDSLVIPVRNKRSVRSSTLRSHSVSNPHAEDYNDWNTRKDAGAGGAITNSCRVTPNLDMPKRTASDFIEKSVLQDSEYNFIKQLPVVNSVMENNTQMQLEQEKKDEDNVVALESQDCMAALNVRVKFRLEKLIQNNPDGIRCIDLQDKYREEYGVSLDWESLGFQRISNFAAHLPDIFHIVGPSAGNEYILYNAKEPLPTDRAQENRKQKLTDANIYASYDSNEDDIEAIPSIISQGISNQISPDDVMTIGESVGQISVTQFKVFTNELDKDRSLVAIRVVESFSPSFFWIQIEKKRERFEKMMNNLQTFYEAWKEKYMVPIIMLEKGLNVVCMFFGRWHRAIIKAVDPQCRVTLLFYDYGTVKTYPANEIFHLHRKFSALPAQAIPCGLYNVRPFHGDKWPKNIIDWFIRRVHDRVMWMMIGRIDTETNSMVISLTDTSKEHDFHVSDKMFEKKMAIRGNMVRIFKKNFVYEHYLQTQLRSQHEDNSIAPNNVKNHTRLSSFENSTSYNSIITPYKEQSPKIESGSVRCSKCGHITEEQNSPNILKNMARLFKNKSSSMKSSIEGNESSEKAMAMSDEMVQLMSEFMDDDIIVHDESMEKSSSPDEKLFVESCSNIPEIIPEFGTFASHEGGHGNMEPINWDHIFESARGNHVRNDNASTPLLSVEGSEKSSRTPSPKNIKKPAPRINPINQRFAKFLDTYHKEQSQNSPLIFQREDQIMNTSVITPMVRRTLNDINKPFNDFVRTVVPEDIRAMLSETSSIALSSENEMNEKNSSESEQNYPESNFQLNSTVNNDLLSVNHQPVEKLCENNHQVRHNKNELDGKDDTNEILHDGLDVNSNDTRKSEHDLGNTSQYDNSIASGKTNSIYLAPGTSIMKRLAQSIKSRASMGSSDNQSTLDSDDSVSCRTSEVIEQSISVEGKTEAELISKSKNDMANELTDLDSLLDYEKFDFVTTDDDLKQMLPREYIMMYERFLQQNCERSDDLKITEIDSDEENKSTDSTNELDISTDIATTLGTTSSASSRPETDSDSQQINSGPDSTENELKIRLQDKLLGGDRGSHDAANADLENISSDDYDDACTESATSRTYPILQRVKESGLSHNLSCGVNVDIDLQSFIEH